MTARNPTFDPQDFKASWEVLRPLVLEEWPAVDSGKLDATSGDAEAVVEVVAEATEHTRTLVRQQLGELAGVAGLGQSALEQRLLRLITHLENEGERFSDRAREARDQAGKVLDEAREQGRVVVDKVKERVPEAEETLKDNIWTALLSALGLGLLFGLIVGLSRGR